MILVDSSVWIDHLRDRDPALVKLLEANQILSHPFIIGELALGSLRQREKVLGALYGLPTAAVAANDEVITLIESQPLHGLGIGYVDAHLLAATRLTAGARLWTRDRRLQTAASTMGIAATASH